jgi:hypothetical protein
VLGKYVDLGLNSCCFLGPRRPDGDDLQTFQPDLVAVYVAKITSAKGEVGAHGSVVG